MSSMQQSGSKSTEIRGAVELSNDTAFTSVDTP